MSSLLDKRLVLVTGKGGVGKTTVAAALGLIAARRGKRVVLCEVAEQTRFGGMLGRGPHAGLELVSVDPERAKREWLSYQLKSRTLAGVLAGSGLFQYLTAAAPGLTELVTMGKVWDLAQIQPRTGGPGHDLTIVDAPATGHGLAMLRAPSTYARIARVGPVGRHAERIDSFVREPAQTGVLTVALPEEMPVNETVEFERALQRELEMAIDTIVVNALHPAGPRPRALRTTLGRTGAEAVIADWLERKEVCICAGSGGVGKTTTSAAIALGMAARGKKVAVLTIDPARRLANALGLRELGNEERRVDVGVEGELWAMMLDAKRTFDELIEWHAPDERTRDAVLSNRIYQELSNALAGSQEYMAMEKLYELSQEGRYDLLVLDTPPTRNALDFLDAPRKLSEFIDSRSLQLLMAPGLFGLKVLGRGTNVAFSVMKRATGVDLLQDLGEFFRSFGDMTEGFRERAGRVNELLAARSSAFVLVTSPRREAIDEGIYFHRRLKDAGLPFAGVIANRVQQAGGGPTRATLVDLCGEELGTKVYDSYEGTRRLAERDQANLDLLRRRRGRTPLIEVPHLPDDVHDLDGLRR